MPRCSEVESMNMNKKILFILGIISLSLLVGGISAYAETEVIKFASGVYPPFTMLNEKKVLYGFDIDMAKAICEKARAQCVFSNEQFINMPSSLKSNKYDAWISAVSICEEHQRLGGITFTNPYFASNVLLIATKNTVFNAAPVEIKGRTIGVADHTCYIQYLKNTYGNIINVKIFPTEKDSFIALEEGLVDAVIDDEIVIRRWRSMQNGKQKYRLIGLPAKYSNLVWHNYGIAVAKNRPELVKRLNVAIERVKSDGTYDRIVKEYLSN